MRTIFSDFMDRNYKKIKLSEELTKLINQHQKASVALLKRYNSEHKLEHPVVEYSRHIFTDGSDEEVLSFMNGVLTNLTLKATVIKTTKSAVYEQSLEGV